MRKTITLALSATVLLFALIQLVPYGREHNNPPVVLEPEWPNPETRLLAQRACFDCHSNESVWPWYSNIAPVSWLVQRDVNEGREALNFSDWGRNPPEHEDEHDEIGEQVREGEMPLPVYLLLHPEASLSEAEKETLARGLEALH